MLTLVVDSYCGKYRRSLANYLLLAAEFSDLRMIEEEEAKPGYDMSCVDAVILSGSQKYITKNEYDAKYLEFIRSLKVPVLGVCYGHQVLALAHGQDVKRKKTFIRKRYPGDAERVKILKADLLLRSLSSPILVDESHQEEVCLVDRRFEVLASSRSSAVEAIRLRRAYKFGVQFHLERSGNCGSVIMDNFYRIVRRRRGR